VALSPRLARRRTGLASLAAGLAVAVFGVLGWLVGSGAASGLDLAISAGVQEAEGALLAAGMRAISAIGSSPVALPVLVGAPVLLWRVGHQLASRFTTVAALGALLGAAALKQLWLRPRPSGDLVEVIGGEPAGYSFPSGHTLLYVSFFGFLLYWAYTFLRPSRLRTILIWTFAALIGLIGVSRVYLGHHWASDVLASYALGFAWLLVLIQLYARARLNPRGAWRS
jgi:undecaprenyl-diphosphatase